MKAAKWDVHAKSATTERGKGDNDGKVKDRNNNAYLGGILCGAFFWLKLHQMGQINVIRSNKSPFLIFKSDQQVVSFSQFTYKPKSRRKSASNCSLVKVLGVCVYPQEGFCSSEIEMYLKHYHSLPKSLYPSNGKRSNVKKVALLISVCVPVNSINIYLLLQKLQEGECRSQQHRWWDLCSYMASFHKILIMTTESVCQK